MALFFGVSMVLWCSGALVLWGFGILMIGGVHGSNRSSNKGVEATRAPYAS